MTLQDLANLGQFVGGLVVIVSLVYLAVQVRQNTQSLRTENYARALDRLASMQARLSGDPAVSTMLARAAADPANVSPAERLQITWWCYECFGAFEFMFHQAQAGAMPDEVWQRWSATVAFWLSFPGVRGWWAARPAPFSESFSRFVDECIRENRADAAAVSRWNAFVRGEARAVPQA